MSKKEQDQEVKANFEVFQKKLPDLLKTHKGKFALMRDEKIIDVYDSLEKASKEGFSQFKDERFSIQEVKGKLADFGYFSHALHRS